MIDPELRPFLEYWTQAWADLPATATPHERRARLAQIAETVRLPMPPTIATEVRLVRFAGQDVRVRIFRGGAAAAAPCLIYMHGGAWMQGSPETHWDVTAQIAAAARQVVISIDYALAPEHPFPIALDQCRAVIEWAFAEAASLGIRRDAITVGGDSAGGNLAAALTLGLRDTACRLAGQVLIYPAVDFEMSRPSYRENANGPLLQVSGMPAVRAMYCPDPTLWTDPRVAPLRAAHHAGLPPAFIAVAEHDPMRDDGRAYAEKLAAAGVPVTLDPGPGLIHGYLRALKYCAAARARLAAICDWLQCINDAANRAAMPIAQQLG